jgi:hypothetical protein
MNPTLIEMINYATWKELQNIIIFIWCKNTFYLHFFNIVKVTQFVENFSIK